jgi:4-hydroxybenzoate polyprenyltransferase
MKSLRARVQHQKGDECSSVNRLQGFFTLLRLRHTGQVVGIVTVLSLKSVGFTLQAVLSITAALLLSTATFMFDDAHDESSDRIVHTQRPIPQGIYSGRQVYLMGILALGTGFVSIQSSSHLVCSFNLSSISIQQNPYPQDSRVRISHRVTTYCRIYR